MAIPTIQFGLIGIDQDEAFAEFVIIPVSNDWKLNPTIPEHYGAILCSFSGNQVFKPAFAGCTPSKTNPRSQPG
jgi:hypothetical protein